jgi:low temperature requirement protein LtrA
VTETALHHRVSRLGGRDPDESHRAASPLELLFDLTFVVAFSQASSQFAHFLAEGHVRAGLVGFGFAAFGVCWAWINYSWFASAYDTDDWVCRVATMVQMIGVLILALGIPPVFRSLDEGGPIDNGVAVFGYVVMRLSMVFQWLRAARDDPDRARACHTYAATISVSQVGWIGLALASLEPEVFFSAAGVLVLIELVGPIKAETFKGGTPWHAGHIAERYGLFTIITLGEAILGTVAALSAVVESQGWSVDAALVGIAGTGLTFGLWWCYFLLPSGRVLAAHRERSFGWGYGHIPLFASIAATGAGLHVAALFIEHQAHISATATVVAVVAPVATTILALYAIYTALLRLADPFHLGLLAATAAVLVAAVALAAAGTAVAVCLLLVTLAPAVTVVGYETIGHRHLQAALEQAEAP